MNYFVVYENTPERNVVGVVGVGGKQSAPEFSVPAIYDENGDLERAEWLQIENVEIQTDVFELRATVNQTLKDQIIADEIAQAPIAAAAVFRYEQRKIAKLRMEFGLEVKAEIALMNGENAWTDEQYNVYLSDRRIQQISLLLNDGAIESARATIAGNDFSAYYTTEQIDAVLALMDDFIAQNPV